MAGDSVRLEGSKGNDLAKIDFRPKITYPHLPDPLNGFGPMQGERAKMGFSMGTEDLEHTHQTLRIIQLYHGPVPYRI